MLKPLLALAILSACSSSIATRAPAPLVPVADAASTEVYELAARRAQMLTWLREYREAGVFSSDDMGRPVSAFVGAGGGRCPMAELIFRSGRADLVAAVVKENNGVRLADVHEGPLYDWMLASGLTLAEINLVQGVMNVDPRWMENLKVETPDIIFASKAQVRGKLETAELALRDNTAASLALAVKRLPAHRTVDELAHAPIASAVLPKPVGLPLIQPIAINIVGGEH